MHDCNQLFNHEVNTSLRNPDSQALLQGFHAFTGLFVLCEYCKAVFLSLDTPDTATKRGSAYVRARSAAIVRGGLRSKHRVSSDSALRGYTALSTSEGELTGPCPFSHSHKCLTLVSLGGPLPLACASDVSVVNFVSSLLNNSFATAPSC